MQVIYNQINNLCFNDSNATIRISQILFTESELPEYTSYTINWSNNIPNNNISNDSSTASFLPNGIYTFRIVSLSSNAISDLYTITVTSPPELKITDVFTTEYSCGDNGHITVSVSGGQPPYVFFANDRVIASSDNSIIFDDLTTNIYSIRVTDANGCEDIWNKSIEIKLSQIYINNIEILPPEILDGPAIISFDIIGDGPFSIYFNNIEDTTKDFTIDLFNTTYITNINSESKTYSYTIPDKIYPGSYRITIGTHFGCTISNDISIPNIIPMAVSITANQNTIDRQVVVSLTEPRFDTILIPYKHIVENSILWQTIKTFNLKDKISIKINDTIYQYTIVRYMANKYALDNNEIEILRLGNTSDSWYYYFYIAPSINLLADDVIDANISIITKDQQEFSLTLGLDDNGDIDTTNPSLVRGSFLLPQTNLNDFVNGGNVYVSIGQPEDADNYDFMLKNIQKNILKNIYSATVLYTSINFLEQFNVLNQNINIGQTACVSSREIYDYMLNIRSFLKAFNNLSNIDTVYIYNLDSIVYNGNISIFIAGNDNIRVNTNIIQNSYNIEYYYFNKNSSQLQVFIQNNSLVKNVYSINNLEGGYVIIRIKDINNNIPRTLTFNNTTINYDNHFTQAKQSIQMANSLITDSFLYGDILVNIPYKTDIIDIPSPVIPSPPPINIDIGDITFAPSPTETTLTTIKQTQDNSNTASLTVRLLPTNTECIIYGPYNYILNFNQDIYLTNMIPGMYTIIGDYDYLSNNNLYQNQYKILLDKNSNEDITIIFQSYFNNIFIQDTI